MKLRIVASFVFIVSCGILFSQNDTTRITFTGDVMLGRGIQKEIQRVGRKDFFRKYNKYFDESDIGIINFECAIHSNSSSVSKRYNFECEADNLDYLKKIGITHLNLANNHSIDFGSCGLKETFKQIKHHNLSPIGFGLDSSRLFSPEIIENKGNKIAVFATILLDLEQYSDTNCRVFINQDIHSILPKKVKEFKSQNPNVLVIILLHWGIEEKAKPSKTQEMYARLLIDYGADLIVGCGSHTLQEYQTYKNKKIYYSLGDFIFDRAQDQGATLHITITNNQIINFKLSDCSTK